jgi:hypothetical protein
MDRMALRVHHVTFDCERPRALADWWASLIGSEVSEDWGEFVRVPAGSVGVDYLAFGRVPEGRVAKNRLHLDLTAGPDRVAEVARATAAGARVLAEHEQPPGFRWTVLSDPEGNEFCISD